MNLLLASNLAKNLMRQHNLFKSYWQFDWNKKKNSLGTCSYSKKIIFLSKKIVPCLKENEVKDTILHEIAHALVGSGQGHNQVWKSKAIEIGCNGYRCADVDLSSIAKYKAICKNCGQTHTVNRRKKRLSWCKCEGNRFRQEMSLIWKQQY